MKLRNWFILYERPGMLNYLFIMFQVQVLDIQEEHIKDSDVLIMGTDGLWDVTSNEKAVEIVQRSLDHFPANDKSRLKYR
jgi:protein phosphatase 1H